MPKLVRVSSRESKKLFRLIRSYQASHPESGTFPGRVALSERARLNARISSTILRDRVLERAYNPGGISLEESRRRMMARALTKAGGDRVKAVRWLESIEERCIQLYWKNPNFQYPVLKREGMRLGYAGDQLDRYVIETSHLVKGPIQGLVSTIRFCEWKLSRKRPTSSQP